jgi:hypothetical protein
MRNERVGWNHLTQDMHQWRKIFEHVNEISISIRHEEFIDHLSD